MNHPVKPAQAQRLLSIDLLRGIVIVLMALDHTRDFFAPTPFNPLDLALGSPAWFWTRWITHLCAPIFVLLAGMSAYLRSRRRNRAEMMRYLLGRGALLVLLELTWVSFSWQFGYSVLILQVIWAIGMSMMALGLLLWLPSWAIALVAAGLILPHNLLDGWHGKDASWLMMAWHQGGYKQLWPGLGAVFAYPLMPWVGLIAAGYALGPLLTWTPPRRQRFLLAASLLLLLSFVVLRSGNFYGDPHDWVAQGRGFGFELMALVDVHKYPPSLLYLCITLSIGLAALALIERWVHRPPHALMLFGSRPMFFYLVHIALIHALAWVYMQWRFGGQVLEQGGWQAPPGYVPSLLICYLAWLTVLVLMFGLTRFWVRLSRARIKPV
ncbi:DUF1624 domain-containing protein [Roseateles oligotrophus]|uniref:Heparan-alpha-glucosaminide N-acetyltransferase domain-containing protein n=1 Tax=Roseateles oligotrophus TaxID=1769250 RepID=A0ABT2YB58_9BURK|nr:heparan-alpha-glucosaminide N-acetyltransferase domain-containing protein [Roseateles oligotrophus]MCV2367531.1 heparan-alpha-glucosaminide N-acetyltransferase domain-containing protein [Roseateles oligotrophus]